MLNHDTFLAAVCANPDDDAPRLVYADWLEEHGDSARAEFIRLQIEMAHLPKHSDKREQLDSRQKRLFSSHRKQWAAPFKGIADRYEFTGGFVTSVTMPAERFDAVAETLFRLAPLRWVTFTNPVGFMHRVANCPFLARLTVVDFVSSYHAAATVIAGGDPFATLGSTTIGLPDDRAGDIELQALVTSPFASSLSWLFLPGCNITAAGLQILLESPVAPRLTRLNLHGNPLGDQGARAIAECQTLQELESLDLSRSGIGVTLGELLLQTLGFSRGAAAVRTSPLQALTASPYFPKLRRLNVRGNRLFPVDRRALRARFHSHVEL